MFNDQHHSQLHDPVEVARDRSAGLGGCARKPPLAMLRALQRSWLGLPRNRRPHGDKRTQNRFHCSAAWHASCRGVLQCKCQFWAQFCIASRNVTTRMEYSLPIAADDTHRCGFASARSGERCESSRWASSPKAGASVRRFSAKDPKRARRDSGDVPVHVRCTLASLGALCARDQPTKNSGQWGIISRKKGTSGRRSERFLEGSRDAGMLWRLFCSDTRVVYQLDRNRTKRCYQALSVKLNDVPSTSASPCRLVTMTLTWQHVELWPCNDSQEPVAVYVRRGHVLGRPRGHSRRSASTPLRSADFDTSFPAVVDLLDRSSFYYWMPVNQGAASLSQFRFMLWILVWAHSLVHEV